jgi:hypothetical protein
MEKREGLVQEVGPEISNTVSFREKNRFANGGAS